MKQTIPLCVDLDGTLIRSDLLVETFFQLLRKNFLYLFCVPFWLLRGKACLKDRIAARVELDAELLPYNQEFLAFLRAEQAGGRPLVLVTASHEKYARQIAGVLGIFDAVLASSPGHNLAGREKSRALVQRYGDQQFDYAGNSKADLAVWRHARQAVLVAPEAGVEASARRCVTVERVFADSHSRVREYLRAMRPHQWLKNVLVFVPLFVSHQWRDIDLLLQSAGAFVAFSLCASAVYLLNDLVDLPDDRGHVRKRTRPFAAGTASVKTGLLLIGLLLITAFTVALQVGLPFTGVLAVYFSVTVAYSLALKRIVLVDVLTLAGLYTTRIFAGAVAISVLPSFWLLALSLFLFLSLAMVKRFAELLTLQDGRQGSPGGRDYQLEDLETLGSLGAAAGYLAVLVLALYINSPEVRILYEHPEVIWLLCPLLLYWVSRVWLVARRGQMHDDPVVFAINDRASRILFILSAGIVLAAI